jgi:uncharacterized membrane protein
MYYLNRGRDPSQPARPPAPDPGAGGRGANAERAVTDSFRGAMNLIGLVLDGAGVLIVALGAAAALVRGLATSGDPYAVRYRRVREDLGRAILLGLEWLIAGDIIRSVVVDPTLINVAVLGIIVVIRTFLSMTLQLEVEGRWPWSRRAARTPEG